MKKKHELTPSTDSGKCELPILNPVELIGYVNEETGVQLKPVEKPSASVTVKRGRLTWIYRKDGTHLKRTPSQQLFRIFYKYARRASLNGLIFILKSRRPTVKALWSLLLLAAIGATTFHLIFLFTSFFQYQNYSKVTLKISSLQFPSVTVCNVNLLRFSQLPRSSTPIQNLFNKKEKQEVHDSNLTDDSNTLTEHDYNITYYSNSTNIRNVNVTAILEASQLDIADPLLEKWVKERETLLCQYCKYCWNQIQTDNSSLYKVEDFFLYLFNKQSIKHRQSLSHQLEDFVKMCSFAGRSCSYQLFKPIVSAQYGNCFTLDNPDFISRKSGAESGLELILSIENDDYLPGVTSGRGARVIIHEPDKPT
ncbi:amiloride-sensitive sodium channel subunit beta-2-like [Physella acuta]|uniref:amiloride-sensitive sodium channel subunit beta-2-like n=1 Tax=Physella acuta TaxID=109671 RepID=UPI0027DE8ACD|nr:amiloride-sensitive sodium channel subunit beta-2-like [Physella acuta]